MELLTQFAKEEQLQDRQQQQFQRYLELLRVWNKTINLTAITDPDKIITYHFKDSLAIDNYINFNEIKTIADIGTGAGFPGLALKIKYPHLSVLLIEVTEKKIRFLQEVIKELGLTDIEICPFDWRTFLRTTDYSIDLFVTRAALAPTELIRIFSPACIYNTTTVAYWASMEWQPTDKEKAFVAKEINYRIGTKMRKFIFFKRSISD